MSSFFYSWCLISLQGRKVGSKVVLNSEERRPLQPVSVTEERGESDWPVLHLHHQIFWDVGAVRREEGGGRCGGCYLGHTRQAEARQTRHSFHLQLVSCQLLLHPARSISSLHNHLQGQVYTTRIFNGNDLLSTKWYFCVS